MTSKDDLISEVLIYESCCSKESEDTIGDAETDISGQKIRGLNAAPLPVGGGALCFKIHT